MSDEEVAFGITHNDHCGTEMWRKEQVARIETGAIPNMMPAELSTDEFDYLLRNSRVSTPWVIVGLLVVANLITGALLLVGA